MLLFIHEIIHLEAGLTAGFITWKIHKKFYTAFLGAILGGIFIDLDHFFDYFLVYGFNFNLQKFINSSYFIISQKIYVPLHAWEWILVLLLVYFWLNKTGVKYFAKNNRFILTFVLALTLGMFSHIVIDTLSYDLKIEGYSFLYRLLIGFNKQVLDG